MLTSKNTNKLSLFLTMRKKQATYLIIIISFIVLSTFGLQFYWNYQNFETSRKATEEEIKTLFEQSITQYFEEQSKRDVVSFLSEDIKFSSADFMTAIRIDTIFQKTIEKVKIKTDSVQQKSKNNKLKSFHFESASSESKLPVIKDSLLNLSQSAIRDSFMKPQILVLKGQKAIDSIGDLNRFKNRIVISMSRDSLDYAQLDSLIQNNLLGNQLPIGWQLYHTKHDTLRFPVEKIMSQFPNSFQSKSSFVNKNESIEIQYNLPQSIIFKKIGVEILLSFLLSIIILFFLIYLLQIIKKQQKMDAYKNEFISNMTHEFKTPITTIKTALEGLTHFNQENNPVKTAQYLEISNHQLDKLNLLVEKILETSTLKTTQVQIQNESINMDGLLDKIVSKYQTITTKKIFVETKNTNILLKSDAFHVEQILSNLVDNAVKYGGNKVLLAMEYRENKLYIHCKDSGKGIEKSEQKKIFEQFYRVSHGNQHDVKGFGIGLFYAQTMAMKLGGNLTYQAQPLSTFTLTLPHEFSH